MIALRPPRWPGDRAAVRAIDTSHESAAAYRLVRDGRAFALERVVVPSPAAGRYDLGAELEAVERADWARVAVRDGSVIGVAAVVLERWNRRARLEHLYVDRRARRLGAGGALVRAALAAAAASGMRCLWVETQAGNAPAVDFYEHLGFAWCGLDTTLYDPAVVDPPEVAVFFARRVDGA